MAAAVPFIVAGVSALSSMSASSAQEQQMENQAQALDSRADALEKEGAAQETLIRSQKDQIIGQQVSAAAGSGVDVTTGSVLDVIEDSAFNIEMDALTTRNNYTTEATAARQEAENMRAAKPTGIAKLMGGVSAGASGYMGAGGSF